MNKMPRGNRDSHLKPRSASGYFQTIMYWKTMVHQVRLPTIYCFNAVVSICIAICAQISFFA
jgi:hypothetical protein